MCGGCLRSFVPEIDFRSGLGILWGSHPYPISEDPGPHRGPGVGGVLGGGNGFSVCRERSPQGQQEGTAP